MATTPRSPELHAGDRLSRDEFERRYAAMPDLKKAELIEGVVYMGSPVSLVRHGRPHSLLAGWLGCYEAMTPGVYSADNSTVRLDLDDEVQPDLVLCIPSRVGGSSKLNQEGYVEGPPELVIEVAASSVSYACTRRRTSTGAMACRSTWCIASTTVKSTGSGSRAGSMDASKRTATAS